ncbi:MAG: hypothetical protein H7308_02960 [Chthonomonadaceae bacterium]|nr:hypothetical protein [Chthonomonadaceae bacterium]
MPWQILLSQPQTQRILRLALSITGGVFAVWLLGAFFLFWSSGRAIGEERRKLATIRQKINEVTVALNHKKQDALNAKSLKVAPPLTFGGIQFANMVGKAGEVAGVEKLNLHYKPPVASTTAPTPAGASTPGGGNTPNPNEPKPAGSPGQGLQVADGWGQAAFEFEVIGSFESLTKTLQGLAQMPSLFDLLKVDLSRSRIDVGGKVVLMMRITGVLYGLADSKS